MDRFFVLIELMMVVSAAGLVWGLDGALRDRLEGVPVVAWLAGADRQPPSRQPVQPSLVTS